MKRAFTNYLLGSAEIEALIGNRITWGVRPQASALPAIALHTIDGAPVYVDEGEAGIARARVQIDCWGTTYDSADDVAKLVKPRLSGNGAAFVQDGIDFEAAFIDSEQDDFERGAGDEEFYRVRLDFIIWHKEL